MWWTLLVLINILFSSPFKHVEDNILRPLCGHPWQSAEPWPVSSAAVWGGLEPGPGGRRKMCSHSAPLPCVVVVKCPSPCVLAWPSEAEHFIVTYNMTEKLICTVLNDWNLRVDCFRNLRLAVLTNKGGEGLALLCDRTAKQILPARFWWVRGGLQIGVMLF